MLALIARGCFTALLSRHHGASLMVRALASRQRVPRTTGDRLRALPPDAIAAVPHYRRP